MRCGRNGDWRGAGREMWGKEGRGMEDRKEGRIEEEAKNRSVKGGEENEGRVE